MPSRAQPALMGVAIMLVLAACSGAADEAGSSAGSEPTPRAAGTAGSTGGAYAFLDRALADEFDGTSVEVLVAWFGPEAEAFEATIAPFAEATGIEVVVEPTSDYDTVLATRIDGGNPPDIAPIPQPGLVRQLASEGHLVNLSDWFNVDRLSADYLDSFMELSSYDDDLFEAAQVDGASHLDSYLRLALPLSVPALAAFAIFQFLWTWNDLLVSLVFLGTGRDVAVLTARLNELAGTRGQDWHLLTAGAFLTIAVPLAVFLSFQRYFVRGMLAGSVKE